MTLIEAMDSNKRFTRPSWGDQSVIYFEPGKGPYTELVDCEYFVLYAGAGEGAFSTSIDLYHSDLVADDYTLLKDGSVA